MQTWCSSSRSSSSRSKSVYSAGEQPAPPQQQQQPYKMSILLLLQQPWSLICPCCAVVLLVWDTATSSPVSHTKFPAKCHCSSTWTTLLEIFCLYDKVWGDQAPPSAPGNIKLDLLVSAEDGNTITYSQLLHHLHLQLVPYKHSLWIWGQSLPAVVLICFPISNIDVLRIAAQSILWPITHNHSLISS